MTNEPKSRKTKRIYAARPTTVTIYLSAAEEEALTACAKAQQQSVPAFVATLLRQRFVTGKVGEQ